MTSESPCLRKDVVLDECLVSRTLRGMADTPPTPPAKASIRRVMTGESNDPLLARLCVSMQITAIAMMGFLATCEACSDLPCRSCTHASGDLQRWSGRLRRWAGRMQAAVRDVASVHAKSALITTAARQQHELGHCTGYNWLACAKYNADLTKWQPVSIGALPPEVKCYWISAYANVCTSPLRDASSFVGCLAT